MEVAQGNVAGIIFCDDYAIASASAEALGGSLIVNRPSTLPGTKGHGKEKKEHPEVDARDKKAKPSLWQPRPGKPAPPLPPKSLLAKQEKAAMAKAAA